MDRIEADATPAEEWLQSLNASCNRLSTQYLNMLRAASSVAALEGQQHQQQQQHQQHDPRAGGGLMAAQDPTPPPPLAADVALSSLQCQLAAENICTATSQILTLIRQLRLSLLLMDEDTIQAEEAVQVERTRERTQQALRDAVQIEQQYMELQQEALR